MNRLALSLAILGANLTSLFVSIGSASHASEPMEILRSTKRSDAEILKALYETVPEHKVAAREMFSTFSKSYQDMTDFKQDLIRQTEEQGVREAKILLKRYYSLVWNFEEERHAGIICMFDKTYPYYEAIILKALDIIQTDPYRAERYLEESQKFYSKCQNRFPESVRLNFKRELGLMQKNEIEEHEQKWASLLVIDGKIRLRSRNEALLKAAITVANADPSVHTFDASEEVIDDSSLALLLDGLNGNDRIKFINLHYNFIGNNSLSSIRNFVVGNPNLLKMELSANLLNWEQVQPIILMLEERQKTGFIVKL